MDSMKHEAFTIDSLIRLVAKHTGERFVTTGAGNHMRLRLEGEADTTDGFSARGRAQIVRYLQGMIRAAQAIAAKGASK